jgi:cytoskeleton protein RodZ
MPQTIGQRLKQAREERLLTIEKAAEQTRIRAHYLEALEADDYTAMPSPVHARGFLRLYAEYLQLDIDQVLEELRQAQANQPEGLVGPVDQVQAETTPLVEESESEPEPVSAIEPELKPEPAPVPEPEDESVQETTEAEQDETPPMVEPREMFWQSWLRRMKRQAGELQSQPTETDEPQPEPVITAVEPVAEAETQIHPEAPLPGSRWTQLRERAMALFRREQAEGQDETIQPEAVVPAPVEVPRPEEDWSQLSPQQLFKHIGRELRQRRDLLSLSLDEVEQHIHVREPFLRTMEAGDFDQLPSSVQTRGMLNNYATFLDLDVDGLLLMYAEALQKQLLERHPEQREKRKSEMPVIRPGMAFLRSFVASDLIFGVGMVIGLVAFAIWAAAQVSYSQAQVDARPSPPSISDVLMASPDAPEVVDVTSTPLPQAVPVGTQDVQEAPVVNPNVNVFVNLAAAERTWVRVVVDGETKFEGRMLPGSAYQFEGEDQIQVLTGNAAALRVTYNQRDLGLLGSYGQVVDEVYTADGIVTPTAQPTPTATKTPPVTITPTPTLTPTPTETLEVNN